MASQLSQPQAVMLEGVHAVVLCIAEGIQSEITLTFGIQATLYAFT
jgi:hypothetical protein